MTFWQILLRVNNALKRADLGTAAEEFRYLATHECDHDSHILLSLGVRYVRIVPLLGKRKRRT